MKNGLRETSVVLIAFTGIGFALGVCLGCKSAPLDSDVVKCIAGVAHVEKNERLESIIECVVESSINFQALEKKGL